MAKKQKLTFETDEQLSIKGAMFQVLKIRNGNMMVRALGGYDMEDGAMVLRNPVLEKRAYSRKSSEDGAEE
jgi:hypothetical protein